MSDNVMRKGIALVLVQTMELDENDGIDREKTEVMEMILPDVNGEPRKISLTGLEGAVIMAAALRASTQAIFKRGVMPRPAVLPEFPALA